MLTISKPLSASQACTYHANEFASRQQNYWSQDQQGHSEWQGRLAGQWNLNGPVHDEHFARLAEGQHPRTGEQLVRHQVSRTYEGKNAREVTSVEHRAGWDATFSAPKSVSITALVGRDDRIRGAHRESVRAALAELEKYTQARIGNIHAPETTGKFVAATFEHDTARPVDGYAAPQLHTHAVIFNVTERDNGQTSALQRHEMFVSQRYVTAVYRSELALRLEKLGYGKTTVLSVIREGAEAEGYRVEGFAPTSRAAQKLSEAGMETSTLQKHLVLGEQPDTGEKRLYVLDESSLASTRQLHEFVHRLHPNDRVMLVGDRRQHEAVEAGRPFAQLQEAGMVTIRLDEIVRQKDPDLKRVVEQLARGEVREAVQNLDRQGRIHEISDHAERIAAIAKEYANLLERTLVVSPDNRSRTEINRGIHEELQGRGIVSNEENQVRTLVPRQARTAPGQSDTKSATYCATRVHRKRPASAGANTHL